MDTGDYAAGCVALTLTVIPWAFASARLAGRLLPGWTGPARVLVTAVLGVSGILVLAELAGMLGSFTRWWVALASALVSAAVLGLVRPSTGTPPGAPEIPDRFRRSEWESLGLALVAALAVSAALLGRDARVLTTGPTDDDALHYHLSDSAWFVQTHSINHLHQTASSDASVYYPLDDELLDAVAMLGPRPDIATLGLNVGFAWLMLLACWVIGARWEMGAAAVAGGASVLAIPLIAGAASGPGLNDIPSMAAFFAAVAVLVHARGRRRWPTATAIAGLGLGLAAGSKLSLLAMVVGIAVTAVIIAPKGRWLTAGVISVAAVVTGGFWFIRDWISVGSPVPSVNLTVGGHGFHQVPYPQVKPFSFTVAHYLTDGAVIRHSFIPALKVVATPAWPIVLGLPALGILAALVLLRSDRIRRSLAVVAELGVAAYLFTPNTALGPEGHPTLFGANVRYLVPVLVVGMLLLVTAAPLRRYPVAVTGLLTIFTLALLQSSTTSAYIDRWRGLALALAVAVGVAWAVTVVRRVPSHLVTAAVGILALLILANGGASLQHHYLEDRYAASTVRDKFFALGSQVSGARIGIVGQPLQYPFTGPRLSNTVQYVGVEAPDHSYGAPTTCRGWTKALRSGRYQYLVFETPTREPIDRLVGWTSSIPGARVIGANAIGYVVSMPADVASINCHAKPLRVAG